MLSAPWSKTDLVERLEAQTTADRYWSSAWRFVVILLYLPTIDWLLCDVVIRVEAVLAIRRMWWSWPMITLTVPCWTATMSGWWSSSPPGVDTAKSMWLSPCLAYIRLVCLSFHWNSTWHAAPCIIEALNPWSIIYKDSKTQWNSSAGWAFPCWLSLMFPVLSRNGQQPPQKSKSRRRVKWNWVLWMLLFTRAWQAAMGYLFDVFQYK